MDLNSPLDSDEQQDTAETVLILEEREHLFEGLIGPYLTLYDLSETLGDRVRQAEYLLKMCACVDTHRNLEYANLSQNLLAQFAGNSAEHKAQLNRINGLIREQGQGIMPLPLEERRIYKFDLVHEISLAEKLRKARVISEDAFLIILRDLCNYSASVVEAPPTVQHILMERRMVESEAVLDFMALDSRMPIIMLRTFTLHKNAYSLLHVEFMKYRAAIIFEQIDNHVIVGLLNPYNKALQKDVAMLCGHPCHFVLTSAQEYDYALDAIRRALMKESGAF